MTNATCGRNGSRIAALAGLLLIALSYLTLTTPQVVNFFVGYDSLEFFFEARHRKLLVGSLAPNDEHLRIELNPPSEFDYRSISEILEIRKRVVEQYAVITGSSYRPSSHVFGEIVDGSPWWGLHGLYFYGPGEKGIEGPSEESRFINNPLLLVGLLEPRAWVTRLQPAAFQEYFPTPRSLIFFPSEAKAECVYNVSGYLKHLEGNRYSGYQNRIVSLSAYNARDFGYNYLYVDPANSLGIDVDSRPVKPVPIRHYIHKGGSCGYPGGCNNMSPYQEEMQLKIQSLPARASIRLWRADPGAVSRREDLLFIINMK
ncbi:MAG: hypothetical protein J5J00_02885 [Deltaproteobacteria bacterium]|nr:hypothetical protein [Deltaproteobacteria bacterium]